MGSPKASFNAKIEIDPGDNGSWEELANVVDGNPDMLQEQIEASQFGDPGERRVDGRVDFNLDLTVNFNLSEPTHQDMLDALRGDPDATPVGVRVYPDRDETGQFISAVCNAESGNLTLGGDDASPIDLTFENSDGSKWSYETGS